MQVKDLIVTGDAKILGNLYTKDGNVGAGGGAGGGEGGSSITYRLTKSGQTITLTGSDGSTSSVVDSDTTTSVDLSGYLPKSGGTMTGALNFKNGTWNTLGDDVYFGDNDTAGSFAIKGANGTTNLKMVANNSSAYGTLSWNGSQFASSNNFTAPAFIENGTALSSKYAPISHSHDDRYFTESEINSKLKGYSPTSHTHNDLKSFVATYGSTKFSEIKAAYNAGKVVYMKDTLYNVKAYLTLISDKSATFIAVILTESDNASSDNPFGASGIWGHRFVVFNDDSWTRSDMVLSNNRGTAVHQPDTNYTTFMARGTSLNSAETTPTANGTVAWTYE